MSVTKNGTIVFDNTVAEPKKFTAIVNSEIPETGTAGQFLKKTSTGVEFADVPGCLPSGGTEGQFLKKTATGEVWAAVPTELPAEGTAGQFLKKTSDGVEYASIVQVPTLPTADGDYKLNIASGVATWVAIV